MEKVEDGGRTQDFANSGSVSTLGNNDKGKTTVTGASAAKANVKCRPRKIPPTIKMRIDNDPLPPQGSDEEDDELLLTGETWDEGV